MEKKKVTKKQTSTIKKKTVTKKPQKKKGFTLIELLAVIIILGILMIIAIPSVTNYISDSRKSAYVDTAKEIVSGTRNLVNDGKLGMYDTNTTYYIPASYINTENGLKSPYGEFTEAYVGVVYDGKGYKYYWISVDDAGQGIRNIKNIDLLSSDDIESDLNADEINRTVKTTGIGNRNSIKILNSDGVWQDFNVQENVSEAGKIIVCKKATKLHEVLCEQRENGLGCNRDIGYGNLIVYGTIPNSVPKTGDAYDCDVNNDGTFDDKTERFYYVYNFGNYSSLIYYKNVKDQVSYDNVGENWHGPRNAYKYLPSTNEWNNPGIVLPGSRQIITEKDTINTDTNQIESFNYSGKAARFLTTQEVRNVCNVTIGDVSFGQLDNCKWLFESQIVYEKEFNSKGYGYWLETPKTSTTSNIYVIDSINNFVYNHIANIEIYSVRPVITVFNSSIEK